MARLSCPPRSSDRPPAALAHANPAAKTRAASGNPAKFWTVFRTVTTHGGVTVGGHVVHVTAKAGTLILRDKADKPIGEMVDVAQFKDGAKLHHRPIAFLYNGGPGGGSAPLHIGAFGSVRVVTLSHEHTPPPLYRRRRLTLDILARHGERLSRRRR